MKKKISQQNLNLEMPSWNFSSANQSQAQRVMSDLAQILEGKWGLCSKGGFVGAWMREPMPLAAATTEPGWRPP
ncbi:hypothetical protein [Bdellovibrio bacteriovorus]|uniref:hypothetical protein n=1 Tax=Bdellovibrio bacteriovorus TaxID=959 RepID=UPI0012F72A66|nr:hypothetical protein [Bdellovibrio bacteriovorus]